MTAPPELWAGLAPETAAGRPGGSTMTGSTHAVANEGTSLSGYDAYACDAALREAVDREGAGWVAGQASVLGRTVGSAEMQELARLADVHRPTLRSHDRFGNRLDVVELHPAYHQAMAIAFGAGVHSLASTATEAGGHVARATLSYLWNQAENGTGCPTGMAYAGLAALCHLPVIGAGWRAKVGSTAYDPRYLPLDQKEGATIGFAMTKKQAGSDLRRVATSATPTGDGAYLLRGHKWFCSAPMSDGIFTLASTPAGPSCFLVPRWLPDGARNPLLVMRLKDKCGNRSNASAEIEYNDTVAWLVGEEGAGIRTILEAAHLTRLDFAVGSAGLVRHALVLAIHHARNRQAFGSRLVDLPLHANVLADLALESEANLVLALRVARATDRAVSDESERLLARIGTPIAKYWNAKRAPQAVAEALECLGGNGYVEDGPLARLYREAPLNGIWEGTSNMMTLDALRANRSDPATFDALLAELAPAAGADRRFDRGLDRLRQELGAAPSDERGARRLAGLRPATHLTVVRFRTVSSCPARS